MTIFESRGVAVITPGTAAPQGRVFIVNCTVTGNVNVTFLNGQSHIIPVAIGYSVLAVFDYERGGVGDDRDCNVRQRHVTWHAASICRTRRIAGGVAS